MSNFFVYDQEKKNHFIASLTEHLAVLRTQAEISQEHLAAVVSISRQTYGSIETQKRTMSWTIYMALILYFNSNQKTKELLYKVVDIPDEIMG